ncbi:uncharacterized protein LOC117808195 [Notolabrus celidotus]|uniref:uncharacterized protein LOC117808195 n=1 Tax=Notolabrus celidotus TaxID=1203425 RepID=UPI00148F6299|nr:uncharacterized protein LOC117808195 [Notolabrus celidotus]
MKTIGNGPDMTQICTNDTQDFIVFVFCKIRTEGRRGEECRLSYQHKSGFEHNCSSGFTLMMENHTVFLHVTSLTPEDGGNHTCECSRADGTYFVHLNMTVEDSDTDNSSSFKQIPLFALLSPTVFILLTAVVLGIIYRRIRNRKLPEPLHSSLPDMEPGDIEPYSTYIQRDCGLYSTVTLPNCNTNNSNIFTGEEKHAAKIL